MKSHFHMKGMSTKTRFEKDAKGNSEMAYCHHRLIHFPYVIEYFLQLRLLFTKCNNQCTPSPEIQFAPRAHYLRNRKHVPCFYRAIETRVKVWENEKCCGNTSRRRVFPQLFRVLPNFHEYFYNSIGTRRTCFLFS